MNFPVVLHEIAGPNISSIEIINIAPAEGQIPVSFTPEPNWEASAFPKEYPNGENYFNEKGDVLITPLKCIPARLKCCDDGFASNPQYISRAFY